MTKRGEVYPINSPHLSVDELVNVFTQAPVCIFKSTESGKLLYINQTGAEMFGYSSSQEMLDYINSMDEGTAVLYPYPQIRLIKRENILNEEGWLETTNAFKRRDGTIFTGKSYTRKVPHNDNEWSFQGFIKNVSQTREIDEDILQKQTIEQLISFNILAMVFFSEN